MGRFLQPSRYTPVANPSHIALATSQHHLTLLHRRLDHLRVRREQLTATIASLRPVYDSAIITHRNHTDSSHSTAAHDEALKLIWDAVSHMSRGELYLASSHATTTAESLNDLAPLLEDLVAVARFSDVSSTPLFQHPSGRVTSTAGPLHSAERCPHTIMTSSSSPASQQLTRDLPGYCMVSSQHS
jgi:hypothetical protein